MKKEKGDKDSKLMKLTDEMLANFCIENYDYNPDSLNELYDSLQSTRDLIRHYMESSGGLPPDFRKEIADIAFDSDSLFLTYNQLYVNSNGIVYKAKKKYLLKEEVEIEKEELEEFLSKFKKARKDLKRLIQRTKDFVDRVRVYPGSFEVA